MDAPGNDGNASMPEQVKRLNPGKADDDDDDGGGGGGGTRTGEPIFRLK